MSRHNRVKKAGFTLIEVTLASLILSVALLASGLLVGKMMTGAGNSKDMSSAAVLASEKLEDLNRWSEDDPQICVPAGKATIGSLSSDLTQTTTCSNGTSASVNYYDDVLPNLKSGSACPDPAAGCFAETVSSVSGTGMVYTTTVHSPNGIVQSISGNVPPSGVTYHRRWIIEANSPTNGVRRITVKVTTVSGSLPVTFQMSIVRP